MKHNRVLLLLGIVLTACSSSLGLESLSAPQYPFPQHVSYAANTIKPNNYSQIVQDQDVKNFYNIWKTRYVVRTGQSLNNIPLYRIAFGKVGSANRVFTVSEGQGYGMVILPLMSGYDANAQAIFDGLWMFSRANPSSIDTRLMGWKVPSESPNSAFDGDADIAYGLLLADKQWGSSGRINYLQEAKTVIQAIRESTLGPVSKLPRLGDWARDLDDPSMYDQFSPRSSDFMPAHFRAYGRATGTVSYWNQVVKATQVVSTTIQQNFSSTTGLLPDFISSTCPSTAYCPAPDYFLEGPNDDSYYYNAGRDPMRLGMDALLNSNGTSKAQVRKMSLWIKTKASGLPANIKAGYALDGTPLPDGNYSSTFFIAPFGVAAMVVPSQQAWLNSIYSAVRATHEDYYQDSVNLLCLLVMTGNYWDPTTIQ